MAWRDDIAGYAENGNVDGVLKVFDELWNDRARRMTNEIAYLQQIAELKGAAPKGRREVVVRVEKYDALEAAFNRLTNAVNAQ